MSARIEYAYECVYEYEHEYMFKGISAIRSWTGACESRGVRNSFETCELLWSRMS